MISVNPGSGRGRFRIEALSIEPVSLSRAVWRRVRPILKQLRNNPSSAGNYAARAFRVARQSGLSGLVRHALRGRSYDDWIMQFDTLTDADRLAMASHASRFQNPPLISVLAPLYKVQEGGLAFPSQVVRGWQSSSLTHVMVQR